MYNPVSGSGRGARAARGAAAQIRGAGRGVVLRATERPRHATELVQQAVSAGAAAIAIAGGDGTVRDAVAGLEGAQTPLAIVPAGTGNDLVRTLRIPANRSAAVDLLLNGTARPVDIWRWNDVPFVNVAGVGLDAAVADTVNRRIRRLRGPLAYLAGVALTLSHFRPIEIELVADEWRFAGTAMLAAFGNGRCYGGGMRIAPAAVVDDGLLDVVVVEGIPRLELVRQMPRVFMGTHLSHPRVQSFRASRIVVRGDPALPVTLDGELLGTLPAEVARAEKPAWFLLP